MEGFFSSEEKGPFSILQIGCSTIAEIILNPGESILAESDALLCCMPGEVIVSSTSGIMKATGRYLAGESFFLQKISAKRKKVVLKLGPKSLHGLAQICQTEETHYVRKGGFFASQLGIETRGQSSGLLKVTGTGHFLIEAFGGIDKITIPRGETAIIDNNHLIAWPCHSNFEVVMASTSIWDSIASGEWSVTKFTGPCEIYMSCSRSQNVQERVSNFNDSASDCIIL